jgi:hypothetical protein
MEPFDEIAVELGPGRKVAAASRSRNCSRVSQRRRVTNSLAKRERSRGGGPPPQAGKKGVMKEELLAQSLRVVKQPPSVFEQDIDTRTLVKQVLAIVK